MASFAQDLDETAGHTGHSVLSAGFARVRGGLFPLPSDSQANNTKGDEAVASSVNTGGILDTLDYAPPSRAEILLAHIEKLLAAGDFEEAAEHILAAAGEGSDIAFTGKQEAILTELAQKTKDMLDANIARKLDDLRREEFLAFVREREDEEELRRLLQLRLEQEGYTPRPGLDFTL